jgi:tetratricopeptide (TPR) repeat protein
MRGEAAGLTKETKVKYYLAGAVALLTFAVYLPTLQNSFVEWDDGAYVFENLHIRSFDPAFLRWAFFSFHAANWHPLTWISHALDYTIWGLDPLGHHLTNNILHAVNTFLVVLLVARLIEAANSFTTHDSRLTSHDSQLTLIAAGTTGLLFGLHPLHVESVAWVAERKDLLCALFFLLSITMYAKYVTETLQRAKGLGHSEKDIMQDAEHKGQRVVNSMRYAPGPLPSFKGPLLYALCFFILALLSKPMAVSLPVVLLILDWYPFQRIYSFKTFLNSSVEKLPFIALSVCSSVLTVLAQKAGAAMTFNIYVPLWARLLVSFKALIAYLWKMVLPLHLMPFYQYPLRRELWSSEYLLAIVAVAGITVFSLALSRKRKVLPAAWGYYVVTLTPVLGVVQVGGQSMADRYTYLPSLAPFLIAGLLASQLYKKGMPPGKWKFVRQTGSALAGIALVVSLVSVTLLQIGIWKNDLTLWTYLIERAPLQVPHAYNNRGFTLLKNGAITQAIEDLQIAVRLDPSNWEPRNNLCLAYKSRGLLEDAREQCETAISLRPDYAEAHNSLGVVYKYQGMYDKAIEQYLEALRLRPDYAEALFNLGIVYLEKGDMDMARRTFEEGLRIRPDDQKAREVLKAITSK